MSSPRTYAMTAAFLAASAITPSFLLVWYFHARDVFREPAEVLWKTFGLGALIVAPVLLFAWPAYQAAQAVESPLLYGLISAFFGAAIPEEIFKFLVLWLYAMRHSEFDEPMDGIVYGVTASLGFATLENILYVAEGGGTSAFLRAFTAVPGHAFLGAIMGYYAGRAHAAPAAARRALLTRALVIPTLLHGLYDFPLLAASKLEDPDTTATLSIFLLLLLVPAILSFELIWTLRLVRRTRAAQLTAPPPAIPAPPAAMPAQPTVPTTPSTTVPAPPPLPSATSGAPVPAGNSRLLGWLLTLTGGLIASLGGLMIFGVLLAFLFGIEDGEELGEIILGTAIVGVLPALVGANLFLWGVRKLNRT